MKFAYCFPALAVLAAPISASAADAVFQPSVIPSTPVSAPVAYSYDWTGAYVGGTVGAQAGKKGLPGFSDFKNGAFNGGVYLGYNHQLDNNWIVGVEGDGNLFKKSKDESSLKYTSSARIRAGYALDRFLPYVDAGVALGKLSVRDGEEKPESHTHLGYTFGGGVEYAVTDNVTTRLSYHYLSLKNRDYDFAGTTTPVGYQGHNVGLGVSFKF